ncbi:hypothetical protein QTH97_10790 [Variovorax sp. J22R24]|uniref:hypothetical protein n=1 Tax=Variovorax gracilis TaxID=3053502 RepID=UPI002575215C|nr:hypothetical protein [Variovorax sp. J22R24]MDM0105421.1 hypothetical protein [Variovorax sp. J22R24]
MVPAHSRDHPLADESADFSLFLGGPLHQLWRRTRLSGNALEMLHRRVFWIVLFAWAPLLLLSITEGQAWGRSVDMPFLRDIETHVRLLVALPLLVAAELIVHRRMRLVTSQFLEHGLIPDAARPQFDEAVTSAMRLRNSVAAEVLLIAIVYTAGLLFTWRAQLELGVSSWHGVTSEARFRPSLAGWWLDFVSLPLFQFLLLRWYFRLFIWARFLWHVSRIDLKLVPTHPDRCAGLGFLSLVRVTFAPFLLAQGALLAGMIADRILYGGANLLDFEVELIGIVAVMVFVVLGPLLAFSIQLDAAARAGKREYGALAQRYVREFDQKWVRGEPPDESLLGNKDIQSLADIGHSFVVVEEMRWAPFTWHTVLQLAITTLLPVLPLTLTMFSATDLINRVLKVFF